MTPITIPIGSKLGGVLARELEELQRLEADFKQRQQASAAITDALVADAGHDPRKYSVALRADEGKWSLELREASAPPVPQIPTSGGQA